MSDASKTSSTGHFEPDKMLFEFPKMSIPPVDTGHQAYQRELHTLNAGILPSSSPADEFPNDLLHFGVAETLETATMHNKFFET